MAPAFDLVRRRIIAFHSEVGVSIIESFQVRSADAVGGRKRMLRLEILTLMKK